MSKFPTAVNLHKTSNTLGLTYGPDEVYQLPAELLRTHSPSAEVQGHGKPILQFGKLNDLLLLAKLEATDYPSDNHPVTVQSLLQTIKNDAQALSGQRGQQIT
ncbi:gamma-butyrobetaine hydroxylase-like domain-containing protein, partial [Klebsiella pneumoniae]|uniref:gamma-butyrobetaine hydroxylase-like domain-containing protein n=1 Tax=Klebsiella pneumoniae TaxID=573 RepID=UPI00272F5DF5